MKVKNCLRASGLLLLPTLVSAAPVQDSLLQRMQALEARNEQLTESIDALTLQLERSQLSQDSIGDQANAPESGSDEANLYGAPTGLTFGGYGEAVFTDYSGNQVSTSDYLRNVLYAGYEFEGDWIFNSEIEFEHATTDESGSTSVEFAYLEYQKSEAMHFRAGLLLTPLGFINEMHEPTTYLGASRPETETRIIPSTWRENGLGILGQRGGFQYKAYLMTGMDAAGFDESGLRGGRQKGSKSKAEDLALAARLDWVEHPGLLVGVSAYVGEADQGQTGLGTVHTSLVDVHTQYQWNAWRFRGLAATARVDNTEELFLASGADATVVGERQNGYYLEAGYDFFHDREAYPAQSLTAFARFEELDTHASVNSALTADPGQQEEIWTLGLQWSPIDNIVFKIDFQDFDRAADRMHLSLGYAF